MHCSGLAVVKLGYRVASTLPVFWAAHTPQMAPLKLLAAQEKQKYEPFSILSLILPRTVFLFLPFLKVVPLVMEEVFPGPT